MSIEIAKLRFGADGLLPAIAQDATPGSAGRVLMLGWANRDAVERTLATGEAHFWSRSRNELWRKGATSGNVLDVESIEVDCDGDALLLHVRPRGPACHTGKASCFDGDAAAPVPSRIDLAALEAIVAGRAAADPAKSYTARLLHDGLNRIAQKVGEEATEVVVAAVAGEGPDRGAAAVVAESADLLFHLAVLLRASGTSVAAVEAELARRHRRS